MSSELTKEKIESAIELMKKHVVKPKTVKTKKEAKRMNKFDKLLGIKSQWKVGDEYYEMHTHPSLFRFVDV